MIIGGRGKVGGHGSGRAWRLRSASANRSDAMVWVVHGCGGTANGIILVGRALGMVWVKRGTRVDRVAQVLERAILGQILVLLPGGLFGLLGLLLAHWRGL